jgi:hypothetical protein
MGALAADIRLIGGRGDLNDRLSVTTAARTLIRPFARGLAQDRRWGSGRRRLTAES